MLSMNGGASVMLPVTNPEQFLVFIEDGGKTGKCLVSKREYRMVKRGDYVECGRRQAMKTGVSYEYKRYAVCDS